MNHSMIRFLLANVYIAAAFCATTGVRSATCLVFAAGWLVASFFAKDRLARQPKSS